MLTELDRQIVQELMKFNVTAKVHRFKDSETGRYFARNNSAMLIPVLEVIERNTENERSFGVDYQLIIFPSEMRHIDAGAGYDIQWDLLNAKTGARVWSTTSGGYHINYGKHDEKAQDRAKTIVDGIIGEMINSNLF